MINAAQAAAKTSTFGSKIATGLSKAAGCAGLAAIAYDAHKLGQLRADEYKKNGIANAGLDAYMDTKSLDSPSFLMNKIQKIRFNMEMNHGVLDTPRNAYKTAKGYVKGFCESLVNNVIPLALTAAAIVTKGKASQAAAAGLAVYSTATVAKDAFGLGKQHPIK